MTKKSIHAPPAPALTTEQIQDFVDETVNSLGIDDLQTLGTNLKIALAQLDRTIDDSDDKINKINSGEGAVYDGKTPIGTDCLEEEQQPLHNLKEAVEEQIEIVRSRIEDEQWIVIDGETIEVDGVRDAHETAPATVDESSRSWYVDESAEAAGKRARASWVDMVENDPKEFTCMVGEETLCKWALNQYAGPGSTQTRNLEEWLDLHLDCPEEQYAGYDGEECTVDFCSAALEDELGFKPTVAYRNN